MRRLSCLVFVALLGALLSLPATAQWKWRDKSGLVQYSDRPPPVGTADADILQRPPVAGTRVPLAAPPAASGASAPLLPAARASEPELEAKRKKAEQEEAAKKKADDERMAMAKVDNCSRARGQLRSLDDGTRMVRTNEKGEREFLDDKARAKEAERVKGVIASDCK